MVSEGYTYNSLSFHFLSSFLDLWFLASMAETTKDPTLDPTNPLFLHHSNGPGLVLTSQLIDNKNYTTWSHAMLVALSMKNKILFVDGSLPKLAADDPTYPAWIRGNNVVISWLYNSWIYIPR
uniref:Retrotransposon Copia-like N-terminal domain-containing protein n=1 Tax=Cajanus cajan TaxID=3821 RepID=A0A151RF92_CAJCA|nr:hypothetical protein KK1_037318 [Cajanus cajan]